MIEQGTHGIPDLGFGTPGDRHPRNQTLIARFARCTDLCLRQRKFVVTTDSDHGLPVYPNLAGALRLTGLNQLWVADVSYVRLELEFVYLAVILDAFSRRVTGWALEPMLEAALTLRALGMALARRRPAPGLVHHSDRGPRGTIKFQRTAGSILTACLSPGDHRTWLLLEYERSPLAGASSIPARPLFALELEPRRSSRESSLHRYGCAAERLHLPV